MRHGAFLWIWGAILLAGCGGNGTGGNGGTSAAAASSAPVHRQPGSWSSKVEIVKLEGPEVSAGAREQMQQMFNMIGAMSVCLTPEMAAREDMSKNLEQQAGSSDCKFDKNGVNGATIDFSALCERQGHKVRMTAHGTAGETSQDLTMTVEPLDATGKANGTMQMHIASSRSGPCKPSDITPPEPGNSAMPKR